MRYAIRHWPGLIAFLDDGRIEMDTVERSIRPHTLLRKNALFAGSDGGARHWSIAMTLIQTAKLNGVDPMAWLTDVLSASSPAEPKFMSCTHCFRGIGRLRESSSSRHWQHSQRQSIRLCQAPRNSPRCLHAIPRNRAVAQLGPWAP
jgi:hypothetical protein